MLSVLHDAYLATATEEGQTRLTAAQTLLVITGNSDPAALARQVAHSGVEFEEQQLSNAISGARTLATQILNNRGQATPSFDHSLNIDWIGSLYASTGCSRSASLGSVTPISQNPGGLERRAPPNSASTSGYIVLLWAAALATATGAVSFVLTKFKPVLYFRKRQAERMPRYPITMSVDVTFTDPDENIRQDQLEAMDISRGGMKLNWPDAPPTGTTVTLSLLGTQHFCQIVWSNSHYAGLLFETLLTQHQISKAKDPKSDN